LPVVRGYKENSTDIVNGFNNQVQYWKEVTKPITDGLVFTCYKGEKPTHVGLVISPTHVIHSRGSVKESGKVEIHSIRAIQSVYGKMTFHKFIGAKNA